MSEVTLQYILRMRPEFWVDNARDRKARHEFYIEAADQIEQLERENAALALVVRKMLLHYPAALNGITTEEELRAALNATRKEQP